jgi:hypothetical protein
MAIPVKFAPQALGFGGVEPGSSGPDITVDPNIATVAPEVMSLAGGLIIQSAPAAANVAAHIEDTSVFTVRDVTVREFVLVEVDPLELPPGFKGHPKHRVLETVAQSDGSVPLAVKKGQFVLVRVQYTAPNRDGTFTGRLVIQGDTWETVEVPLSLFTANIETIFGITPLIISQGRQAELQAFVKSLAGPAVDVHYETSRLQLHTGISLDANSLHLNSGESTSTKLILHADKDAPLGENTLFIDEIAFKRKGLLLPVQVVPIPEALLRAEASRKIRAKYDEIGGPNSVLGLPVDPKMELRSTGDTSFSVDFRGGHIDIADALEGSAEVKPTDFVQVFWVGLECQVRQEKSDELYGGVSTIVPSIKLAGGTTPFGTQIFPDDGNGTIAMGPDNRRIQSEAALLYEGPPNNVLINCHLIEHDSGDPRDAKRAIKDAVEAAAKTLSAANGIDAEHLAAQEDFLSNYSKSILNGVSNLLGNSDDQYNPGNLILHWEDLKVGHTFKRSELKRNDDPTRLEFTNSVIVTGKDDGGDIGVYAFYFDVRTFEKKPN